MAASLILITNIIMSASKLITVFGATGYQGGSVVQSLLENKSKAFTLRGITRNPESEKAKALAEQGVEVVKADGFIKEQLLEAFKGSWGLFVNTNSEDPAIDPKNGPTELDLGKTIIDAAAEAGVQHFVYSGMASAKEITNGEIPNQPFDEKHAVGEYAKTKGFKTVALVSPGWYMENHLVEELAPVIGGFPFTPDGEGYLTLQVPRWGGNEEIPFIAIGQDYGDLVHGVFLNPDKYNGRLIHGASQSISAEAFVQAFEKVTGKKSRYIAVEDWKSFETYGRGDLETIKYMFGFCQHSGGKYYGVPNDVSTPAALKAAAARAKGKAGEGSLTTAEGFFQMYFAI
ncbi:NmrA-like family domain-containing oxidoreductase lnaB [Paramyrothecium foliicola]|nr:NmrA-like family domain-containing oxidoreductase lnaB [Paramyrothecium foliicola]